MAKTLATRMAFGKELLELAKTHDFVVCSADTKTCGLEHFGELFPGREFTFGIAEQNLTAASAGLASCGNKVYLATFAVFASMRACEQVRTFICHTKQNVTIIGTHTGLQVGGDGATHAAVEDVSIMRAFPNMTIWQPADAVSARKMAKASLDFEGPLYIRLHRNPVPDVYDESYRFMPGKATLVKETGRDLTIISSGILLAKAIATVEALKAQGAGVRILDMSTIKPLDTEAVEAAARETGAILTLEDATVMGGLGSAVAEYAAQHCPVPMALVGIPDCFGESGDPELIYRDCGMDEEAIAKRALSLLARK